MPKKDETSDLNPSLKSEFLWMREAKEGYTVVDGTRVSGVVVPLTKRSYIEPFLIRSESKELQVEYSPAKKYPFMYREFATTNRDKESAVEFAKRYGMLGIERECQIAEVHHPKVIVGEPIRSWFGAMDDIASAIELWDSYASNDVEKLGRQIQWDKTNTLLMHNWDNPYSGNNALNIAVDGRVDAPLVKALKMLTLQEQAHFIVTEKINKYFDQYTSAKVSVEQSASNKTPTVRVTPKNLLGWLWLQLAQEVTREMVYFECLNCGKPVLKKVTRGQPGKTCSASCRVQISQRKSKLNSE